MQLDPKAVKARAGTGNKTPRTKKLALAPQPPPGHRSKTEGFDASAFLAKTGLGKVIVHHPKGAVVFSQGDPAADVYFIQKGKIKISVVSSQGREAIVAVLSNGDFLGEDCIATTHRVRLVTATTLTNCSLLKIARTQMIRTLKKEHAFSDVFVSFLLARSARVQEDLIDQLFNSSEKRLARVLLLLAQFGKEGKPEVVIPRLSQEALAEMVGTTRSRVSYFMNRFRKLGFIKYNGEITVNSGLLNVVLHD